MSSYFDYENGKTFRQFDVAYFREVCMRLIRVWVLETAWNKGSSSTKVLADDFPG